MKKYTVTADIPEGYGGRIEFLINRGKGFIPIPGVKGPWWSTWDCHVELEDDETAIVRAIMTITEFPDYWNGCPSPQIETRDVIVGEQPTRLDAPDFPSQEWLDELREQEEILFYGKPLKELIKDMEQVNYVHIDEDSAYYTELQGILQEVQALHRRIISNDLKKGYNGFRLHGVPVHNASSAEEDAASIIKALENSIEKGYKIVDPAPEGMITAHVPVGSYVVPPEERERVKESTIDNLVGSIIQAIHDQSGKYPGSYSGHNREMLSKAFEAFLNIK